MAHINVFPFKLLKMNNKIKENVSVICVNNE